LIKNSERLGARIFLAAADHYFLITAIGIFLVLLDGMHRADTNIRSQLNVSVTSASADVGHPFAVYAVNRTYRDEEVLLLVKKELREMVEKWNASGSSRFGLQAIGLRGRLLYDSRTDGIQTYHPIASRSKPLLNIFRPREPVRFAEYNPAEGWLLRTTIGRRDYMYMVAEQLLSTALPLSAVVFLLSLFPRFYRNSLVGRRHFEALIKIVLTNPSALKNEDELIIHLPAYVREVLELDSVAVYWMSQDRMTLRAVDSVDPYDAGAVRDAREKNMLTLNSHAWEAQALSENRLVRAKRHGWRRDVHISDPESSRDATYIISPIFDPKKHQIVGLITAERLHDIDPGDADALLNLARLVMILIETARSALETEMNFRGMIAQARKVSIGTVVPVLTHNLNTPLSIVSMQVRDLIEKWPRMSPEAIRSTLTQIQRLTADCLSYVKTINDYRRIGAPFGPNVSPETSDLYDVIEKICAFFREYLRLHRIRLEHYLQPDFRPRVKLRAEEIQQVITNMLINADEAFADEMMDKSVNRPQRRIEIRVTAAEDPNGVLIRVKDNGPGIAPKDRELIFTDDFTTKADGTGVGLPYSRRVIRWAGGTLDLELTNEPGASFKIFLPMIEGGKA